MPFAVGPGRYWARLQRVEADGGGDWFAYRLGPASDSEGSALGAIWFPRRQAGTPATIADDGGSWTEFWDNNGPVFHPVPRWEVRIDPPVAEGGLRPRGVTFSYSSMPNANIAWDPEANQVVSSIGGDTRRVQGPGTVRFR
jgi:hypothetical protein